MSDLVPGKHYHDGLCLMKFVSASHLTETVKHLELHPHDVIVTGYPKSGNIWMQTTVSAILSDDLDRFESEGCPETFGSIDLEFRIKRLADSPRPTVLQSHLLRHLLPDDVTRKNVKIVHVLRNPKDVAVSYYYFCKLLTWTNYTGTWDEFFNEFMKGEVGYGDWFHHTRQWLKHENDPNIHFVKYEDFVDDRSQTIKGISEFLGRDLSEQQIERISGMMSFQGMKQNPNFNMENKRLFNTDGYFMRKGKIGDWKNHFTVKQNEMFDEVYKKFVEETGASFTFT